MPETTWSTWTCVVQHDSGLHADKIDASHNERIRNACAAVLLHFPFFQWRLTSPQGPLEAILAFEVCGEEEVEDAAEAGERQRDPERHRQLFVLEPKRRDSVLHNCNVEIVPSEVRTPLHSISSMANADGILHSCTAQPSSEQPQSVHHVSCDWWGDLPVSEPFPDPKMRRPSSMMGSMYLVPLSSAPAANVLDPMTHSPENMNTPAESRNIMSQDKHG